MAYRCGMSFSKVRFGEMRFGEMRFGEKRGNLCICCIESIQLGPTINVMT